MMKDINDLYFCSGCINPDSECTLRFVEEYAKATKWVTLE